MKNGKLYVFSDCRVCVLKGWPEMAAWTKSRRHPQWSRFRPELDLGISDVAPVRPRHRFHPGLGLPRGPQNPPGEEPEPAPGPVPWHVELTQRDWSLRVQFLNGIPRGIREIVEPFATRHWHLLSMAARCPGALDLLRENPGLGFALASCWVFRSTPSGPAMRWIRRMLPRPRREIAAALGFPDCELSVRVLRKLTPDACCVNHLLALRTFLRDARTAKLLAHLPTIDSVVLALLTRPSLRGAIDARLLSEICSGAPLPVDRTMIPTMLMDYRRMQRALGETDTRERQFHSVRQLIAEHDATAARFMRRGVPAGGSIDFPPPPLPGTSTIVPIASVDELFAEGRDQQNCVASYARTIAEGALYIYRLLAPERATVALRRTHRTWEVDQVAAARNAPVSEATYAALASWLGIDAPF